MLKTSSNRHLKHQIQNRKASALEIRSSSEDGGADRAESTAALLLKVGLDWAPTKFQYQCLLSATSAQSNGIVTPKSAQDKKETERPATLLMN